MEPQGQEQDEFGPPQEIPIDINRQINHLIKSFTDQNAQAQWKISQHAAQIDHLMIERAEREALVEALQQALVSEQEHVRKLEGLLERSSTRTLSALNLADDPQPGGDAILAMSAPLSGQPGLGGDARSAESSDPTA